MPSYFKSRRSVFFNIAIFFALIAAWVFFHMQPVLKVRALDMLEEALPEFLQTYVETAADRLIVDDDVFFGTVSYAAIPSIFGGSDIPFLDRTIFRLNGDDGVDFSLYMARETYDEMAEWYSFADKDAGEVSLQIIAARASSGHYVVKSISTTDDELDWEGVAEYQMHWCWIGLMVVALASIFMLVFLRMGIRSKR